MKKWLIGCGALAGLVLMLIACSAVSDRVDSETNDTQVEPSVSQEPSPIAQEEMQAFFVNPDRFQGRSITVYGKVFNVMDGQFQMYADPESMNHNIIVLGDTSQVKNDAIVKVVGVVNGNHAYENLMGAQMTAALIEATSVEEADYITAFHPAVKTIQVGTEKNQFGNKVKVEKVEIAENQTRVYLTVKNDSKHTFNIYTHSMKIVQNGKQFEEEFGLGSDEYLPKIQSDLLPGSTTEGIVVFPAIKPDSGSFKIHMEGSSENYHIDLKPFVFEVKN